MAVQAQLKWTEGMQFIGRIGDGSAMVLDNPEGGSGPSPMQLVLMGVAGCTAMDVVFILRKKRLHLTDFTINISGKRTDTHPKRYESIRIEYLLKGKDLKPKAVEQAITLSQEKYCSATASLNADLTHTYKIIDSEA
jgi:putative redox protein